MASVFKATAAFEREYDELFDFIGASAAAIWNMRWQVRGYRDAHPAASDQQLAGHFIAGTKIGRFKFSYFTEKDWETQEHSVARSALVNVIALYERWMEGVAPLQMVQTRRGQRRGPDRAVVEAIPEPGDPLFQQAVADMRRRVGAASSPIMADLFAGTLRQASAYEGQEFHVLLVLYRFFKELRNQYMHRSLAPDARLINAHAAASSVTYSKQKGAGISALTISPSNVSPLDLKTAFFACHVVRSLVRTIDLELGETASALDELVERCVARGIKQVRWGGDETRTAARLGRRLMAVGLPRPVGGVLLLDELRSRGVVRVV